MRQTLAICVIVGLALGAALDPALVPHHALQPWHHRAIGLAVLLCLALLWRAPAARTDGSALGAGALALLAALGLVLAAGHDPAGAEVTHQTLMALKRAPPAGPPAPNAFGELRLDMQTRTLVHSGAGVARAAVPNNTQRVWVGVARLEGRDGEVSFTLLRDGRPVDTRVVALAGLEPLRWSDVALEPGVGGGPIELVVDVDATDGVFVSRPAAPLKAVAGPRVCLLVSIDTLRADFLGSYGFEPWPTSPHLDRLAAEGVRFATAISPSPWTIPSHMAVLTGQAPDALGLDALIEDIPRVPPSRRSLADAFADAGYLPVAFTGTGTLASVHGFADGFYLQQEARRDSTQPAGADLDHNVYAARTWLAEHADVPLFVFLQSFEVHAPYTHNRFLDTRLPTGSMDRERAMYASGVAYTDERLGAFFDDLKALGLLDDAVIAVMSDHGEAFMEHGTARHGRSLYDEVLKVPLILWGKGLPRGQVVQPQVPLLGLTATLAELFKLELQPGLESRSLMPFVRGEGVEGAVPICCTAHVQKMWGVRSPEAKLILAESSASELYDLRQDPGERRDVFAAEPELAAALRGSVEARRRALDPAERAPVEAVQRAPELEEELRALGYIE